MSAAPSILSPEAVTGAHGSSLQRLVGHPSNYQALPNNRKIVEDFSSAQAACALVFGHDERNIQSGKNPQPPRWSLGGRQISAPSARTFFLGRAPRGRGHHNQQTLDQAANQSGSQLVGTRLRGVDVSDITKYLASIGARGGKAGTGKSKARTKAQSRAAAKARWAKWRAARMPNDQAQPLAGAPGSDSAGQPCRLCEAKGWRWVRKYPMTAPRWLIKTVCCDCNGTGLRPVRPNAELSDSRPL